MLVHRGDTSHLSIGSMTHESVSVKPTKQVFGKFSARLRMVCEVIAARVVRLRVARRRAPSQASVHESARYPKSLRSGFEPTPPGHRQTPPIYILCQRRLHFWICLGPPDVRVVVRAVGGGGLLEMAWCRKNFWYFWVYKNAPHT